jgi:hypothetical protein
MVDMDVPDGLDDFWLGYCHGYWANLQIGDVATPANANVIVWAPPGPPSGSHRYTLVLFEQTAGMVADLAALAASLGAFGSTLPAGSPFPFVASSAATAQSLMAVNAHFYYTPCTDAWAAAAGMNCRPKCEAINGCPSFNLYGATVCYCDEVSFGADVTEPPTMERGDCCDVGEHGNRWSDGHP